MAPNELITNSKYFLLAIFNQKWLAYLIAAIMTFLAPLAPLYGVVLIVIAGDIVTGLLKSLKLNDKISSNRMGRSVVKVLIYHLLLTIIYAFSYFLIGKGIALHITQYSMALILLTEVFSLIENCAILTGNNRILELKDWIGGLIKKKGEKIK